MIRPQTYWLEAIVLGLGMLAIFYGIFQQDLNPDGRFGGLISLQHVSRAQPIYAYPPPALPEQPGLPSRTLSAYPSGSGF